MQIHDFFPHSDTDYTSHAFTINNNTVENVVEFVFLGIRLDCHLKFDSHCNKVINKLNSASFLVYKLRFSIPRTVLINLFYATGISHIIFGIVVYVPGLNVSFYKKLEKRYIDCGRNILFDRKGTSPECVLQQLGWRSLKQLLFYHQSVLIFTTLTHATSLQQYLTKTIHTYSTINVSSLQLPHSRTNKGKLKFTYWAASIWKNITPQMKETTSLSIFKSLMKKTT